ncbi:MAG: carboxypeptidase regulatory-like domain-containing protein [Planctomycetota bacterium]
MRPKHATALLLVVVVLAIAATLALRGGRDDASVAHRDVGRDDAAAPSDDVELAAVPEGDGGSTARRATTEDAAEAPALAEVDVPPPAADERALDVVVVWPEGAEPSADLVVYAFARRVSTIDLAGTLGSDAGISRRDVPPVFAELDDPRKTLDSVRDAILDEQPVSLDAEGRWHARLNVPKSRRRVFVQAFGGGVYTRRAAEAFAASDLVTLRPALGATLDVVVRAGEGAENLSLEGASVYAVTSTEAAASMAMGGGGEPALRARKRLDADGRVRFGTLPAGVALEMDMRAEGVAPIDMEVAALAPGETREVELTVAQGARIEGRVLRADGGPASEARVTASIAGRVFGFDDDVIAETTSDATGHFALEHVPDGRIVVRGDADDALESERVQVEITGGRDAVDVEIVLEDGGTLVGVVRRADGLSAAGAPLEAVFDVAHSAGPAGFGALRGARSRTVAGEDGTFRLSGLGDGPFSVRATLEDDAGRALSGRVDGVRPGADEVDLVLRPPLTVSGVVVGPSQEPLAGIHIHGARLVSGALGDVRLDDRGTETDELGRFALEGLVAGRWDLSARTEAFISLESTVLDVEEAIDGVEMRVVPTATISGSVLDPGGEPISGALVEEGADVAAWMREVQRDPGGVTTRTGEDGTFLLVGIRPGTVQLAASAPDLSPTETEGMEVEPGAVLEGVELRLGTGGAIEGVCFDDDGIPASGRVVRVQSATLSQARSGVVGDDGSFRFRGLPPGTYQVVAADPNADMTDDIDGASIATMFQSIDMASVEVVEGETAIVYLGAPPSSPVEVTGRVEQGGEPFAGAMVSWMPRSKQRIERMKVSSTDEDGRYALTLDEPGDYVVTVARLPGGTGQQQTVEFNDTVPLDVSGHERDFEVPGGAIVGRVLGPDERPLAGARVSVMESGGIRTDRMIGGSYAEIETDASGAFSAEGLRPGTYQVAAGGARMFSDSMAAPSRVVVDGISIGENERREGVELRLPEPGAVDVVVRDASGSGVKDAMVFVRDEKGRHTELISTLVTDSDGRARATGLAPGRYTLAARTATDAATESAPIQVVAGETAEASLLLGPGAFVRVILKHKGDAAVPAGRIQVLDAQDRDVTGWLGLSGIAAGYDDETFSRTERRFGPFPLGRYDVIVRGDDGTEGERTVRLTEPGERRVTIVLR